MAPRLRRVKIRDFQSLEALDVELGQATVIVGPNSVGKSAFVRALEAAMCNWTGGRFVREGQSSTEVSLLFDDHWLIWRKPRRGGAEYEIRRDGQEQGQVITRIGKDVPPEVQELTGVREVRAEGVSATLQFARQFDLPFLFSATGGQAARLLGAVSKLDALVKAQVAARRDYGREKPAAEAAQQRVDGLRTQLEALPDYEALLVRWQELSDRAEAGAAETTQLRNDLTQVDEVGSLALLQNSWREKELPRRLAEVVAEVEAVGNDGRLVEERRKLELLQSTWREKQLPWRLAEAVREVESLTEAATLLRGAAEAEAELEECRTKLQADRDGLEASERGLESLLAELGVCPVCGQAMPSAAARGEATC